MREKILELLKKVCGEGNYENEKALVDNGILNSLQTTDLISELNFEFDIVVPYDKISPEYFNSVDAIVSLVEELKK